MNRLIFTIESYFNWKAYQGNICLNSLLIVLRVDEKLVANNDNSIWLEIIVQILRTQINRHLDHSILVNRMIGV